LIEQLRDFGFYKASYITDIEEIFFHGNKAAGIFFHGNNAAGILT
jgi:hypothetical protein